MAFTNHLSIGNIKTTHRGRRVSSALASVSYLNFVENLEDTYTFEEVVVTPEVKHRADLISHAFYDTVDLDWLVLLCNNINDPFEGLNIGDRIRLPLF